MISELETFGLVYIEAMAAGCITIASRNEGFDGIIKDGVFRIKNCSELEVIHIGKKSFYEMDGQLVIECIFD